MTTKDTTQKRQVADWLVAGNERVMPNVTLLRLARDDGELPQVEPGQFAMLQCQAAEVLLRRPISIHDIDEERGELHFLVATVGKGTQWMAGLKAGERVNALLPLGHGFTVHQRARCLLVGGGIGIAPLLLLGRRLRAVGSEPTFLLGGRSRDNLCRIEAFEALGRVFLTTEDGSAGERGFVTQHSLLQKETFAHVATCGPRPMMEAVMDWSRAQDTDCEVSLENRMACGLGACLCCVEQTTTGHRCVCTDGPVFNEREVKR